MATSYKLQATSQKRAACSVQRAACRAFTLVELLVSLGIFLMVMSLVSVFLIQIFRSFHKGQRISYKQSRQRSCLYRMSRDISSLVKTIYPQQNQILVARAQEFFFIVAKESSLIESRYVCNLANHTLEYYFQEPADYDEGTYQIKEICLENLVGCSFSYSDGQVWRSDWSQDEVQIPRLVKITFQYEDDPQAQEIVVNIPVSP